MRKYISPNVAFFMGLFMLISAVFYTSTMATVLDFSHIDRIIRLIIGFPAIALVFSGTASMLWALIMRPKLRFSAEADGWVLKSTGFAEESRQVSRGSIDGLF